MADSASESDSGSVDGGGMMPPSPVSREQLHKRIESLQQQNRVLKVELETYKLRVKQLQEENRTLRQASVNIVYFYIVFFYSSCHITNSTTFKKFSKKLANWLSDPKLILLETILFVKLKRKMFWFSLVY